MSMNRYDSREGDERRFACCGGCDSVLECLCENVGRVVTVFTASGGVSGSGFTGLLVAVNEHSCKLVTSLPSAPPYPFQNGRNQTANNGGGNGCCCPPINWNRGCCSRFGTSIIIPTHQIVSFVFAEV